MNLVLLVDVIGGEIGQKTESSSSSSIRISLSISPSDHVRVLFDRLQQELQLPSPIAMAEYYTPTAASAGQWHPLSSLAGLGSKARLRLYLENRIFGSRLRSSKLVEVPLTSPVLDEMQIFLDSFVSERSKRVRLLIRAVDAVRNSETERKFEERLKEMVEEHAPTLRMFCPSNGGNCRKLMAFVEGGVVLPLRGEGGGGKCFRFPCDKIEDVLFSGAPPQILVCEAAVGRLMRLGNGERTDAAQLKRDLFDSASTFSDPTDPKSPLIHMIYDANQLLPVYVLTVEIQTMQSDTEGDDALLQAFNSNGTSRRRPPTPSIDMETRKEEEKSGFGQVAIERRRDCWRHQRELEFVCETCEGVAVCSMCVLMGKHKDHEIKGIASVDNERISLIGQAALEIIESRDLLWNRTIMLQEMAHLIEGKIEELKAEQGEREASLHSEFEALHSEVAERENLLVSSIMEQAELKMHTIRSGIGSFVQRREALKENARYVVESLRSSSRKQELVIGVSALLFEMNSPPPPPKPPVKAKFAEFDKEEAKNSLKVIRKMTFRAGHTIFSSSKVVGPLSLLSISGAGFAVERENNHLELSQPAAKGGGGGGVLKQVEVLECSENELVVEIPEGLRDGPIFAVLTIANIPSGVPVIVAEHVYSRHPTLQLVQSGLQIADDGVTVTCERSGNHTGLLGSVVWSHGRHYWEVVLHHLSFSLFGIASPKAKISTHPFLDGVSFLLQTQGKSMFLWHEGGPEKYGHRIMQNGDRLGICVDLDALTLVFFINGEQQGVISMTAEDRREGVCVAACIYAGDVATFDFDAMEPTGEREFEW